MQAQSVDVLTLSNGNTKGGRSSTWGSNGKKEHVKAASSPRFSILNRTERWSTFSGAEATKPSASAPAASKPMSRFSVAQASAWRMEGRGRIRNNGSCGSRASASSLGASSLEGRLELAERRADQAEARAEMAEARIEEYRRRAAHAEKQEARLRIEMRLEIIERERALIAGELRDAELMSLRVGRKKPAEGSVTAMSSFGARTMFSSRWSWGARPTWPKRRNASRGNAGAPSAAPAGAMPEGLGEPAIAAAVEQPPAATTSLREDSGRTSPKMNADV
eukprot:CAMPEP_0115884468 /NCGR_PEP_ID=MMETSP0287-20121206/30135_1 /TAXON_ID=412157 /ORGANISM="Chrysochromulina rotalis, Strain UIO044" /LENGTH=277 /DNA_ID=CAMNT_0003340777 /DNA_START=56 /DNA_END=889 /DNA_ORIENTATION=+